MKKLLFALNALLWVCLFQACSPEDYKEVGTATDKAALFSGKWKVTKVIQQDLDAIELGFPYKQNDITTLAPFTTSSITFNMDGGKPSAFTVDKATAPFFLPLSSGTWKVDNAMAPGFITLSSGTTNIDLEIGSYVLLGQNKLRLTVYRKLDGVKVTGYQYEFSKL